MSNKTCIFPKKNYTKKFYSVVLLFFFKMIVRCVCERINALFVEISYFLFTKKYKTKSLNLFEDYQPCTHAHRYTTGFIGFFIWKKILIQQPLYL